MGGHLGPGEVQRGSPARVHHGPRCARLCQAAEWIELRLQPRLHHIERRN
jgi:hypothetical protein